MDEINGLGKKTIKGMLWKLFEKIGYQAMQVVIQIILARLLLPEEYGIIGLLTIFITLSDIFITQGLTTALIQKKSVDEIELSSVFVLNILISVILYIILYCAAPFVAKFYNESALTDIMRVISISIIIGAIPAVHNAILSRELDFRKSFFRNIFNVIAQGVVGIPLAFLGFGAWSMVYARIAGTLAGTVVLCSIVKWVPKKYFSLQKVKSLFKYSSKILITNLLNCLFNNIPVLIIGKLYCAKEIGYYQRGQQIPNSIMIAFDGSMAEVLYPAFSKLQNDITMLKNAVRKAIGISMFIMLPVLFGLMAIAEPLTIILLTEKWLPSVPIMQLSCVICMFWPLSHSGNALNAIGFSNITLKLSIIGKVVTLIMILVFMRSGIQAIMVAMIISSFINIFVTQCYVNKYIGYSMKELIKDISPSIILSMVMGVIVLLVGQIRINIFICLILQVLVGIVIYVSGAHILKVESYKYIATQVKSIFSLSRHKFS